MGHEMRLDLKVTGIQKYHRAAEALERLARANKMLAQSGGSPLPIPSGGGGSGTGGGGGKRVPAPPRLANGPHARMQQAQANLHAAMQSGNPTAIADAHLLMQRAQAGINRLAPPSFSTRLNRFVASTRFGGNVSPLVGQTASLLGISSKLVGPIGLAVAGLTALWMITMKLKDSLAQYGKDRGAGGGTPGQTQIARALTNATGVDIFGISRQMQRGFYEPGEESMHLRRYGYEPPGVGMNRNTNSLKEGLRVLKEMVKGGDLRGLQSMGAEGLYSMKGLSKSDIDRYFTALETSMSDDKTAAATKFNMEMEILKINFMGALTSLTPLIEGLGKLTQIAADFVNSPLGQFLIRASMGGLAPIVGNGSKPGGKSPVEKNAEALDRNTVANENLTNAVTDMSQQMRGAGAKARAAMPGGWSAHFFDQNAMKEAIALGAFT